MHINLPLVVLLCTAQRVFSPSPIGSPAKVPDIPRFHSSSQSQPADAPEELMLTEDAEPEEVSTMVVDEHTSGMMYEKVKPRKNPFGAMFSSAGVSASSASASSASASGAMAPPPYPMVEMLVCTVITETLDAGSKAIQRVNPGQLLEVAGAPALFRELTRVPIGRPDAIFGWVSILTNGEPPVHLARWVQEADSDDESKPDDQARVDLSQGQDLVPVEPVHDHGPDADGAEYWELAKLHVAMHGMPQMLLDLASEWDLPEDWQGLQAGTLLELKQNLDRLKPHDLRSLVVKLGVLTEMEAKRTKRPRLAHLLALQFRLDYVDPHINMEQINAFKANGGVVQPNLPPDADEFERLYVDAYPVVPAKLMARVIQEIFDERNVQVAPTVTSLSKDFVENLHGRIEQVAGLLLNDMAYVSEHSTKSKRKTIVITPWSTALAQSRHMSSWNTLSSLVTQLMQDQDPEQIYQGQEILVTGPFNMISDHFFRKLLLVPGMYTKVTLKPAACDAVRNFLLRFATVTIHKCLTTAASKQSRCIHALDMGF